MEGHSRNFSNAAFASAPASERMGIRPPENRVDGSKWESRIVSRKNAGRVYAPAFFLGETPPG
jgi:hypothetical protein